jgi:hypothetical protein
MFDTIEFVVESPRFSGQEGNHATWNLDFMIALRMT